MAQGFHEDSCSMTAQTRSLFRLYFVAFCLARAIRVGLSGIMIIVLNCTDTSCVTRYNVCHAYTRSNRTVQAGVGGNGFAQTTEPDSAHQSPVGRNAQARS